MIIPFFIPHSGCPHQCVFCNQKNIIGQNLPEDVAAMPDKINRYVNRNNSSEPVQIAFYGGSFTALPLDKQKACLEAVRPFIQAGHIRNIRLSTRPDCISTEILSFLKEHHVSVVELGAQSMEDNVLARSGRGHTAGDTTRAVRLLREQGFAIGLQIMPGLPGDSAELFHQTVDRVIALKPHFVRMYPALVIKGTPLEHLYTGGQYTPLAIDEAVALCRDAVVKFELAGIDVIRIGLQSTEELEKPGTILAGPYHPAFRQLVDSSIFLDKMRAALKEKPCRNDTAVFAVNPRDVSAAIGQQGKNRETLRREFRLEKISIVEDPNVGRGKGPKLLAT